MKKNGLNIPSYAIIQCLIALAIVGFAMTQIKELSGKLVIFGLLGLYFLSSLLERRRYEKKLVEVSIYIREIFDGITEHKTFRDTDDLLSKIIEQLQRLEEMMSGTKQKIIADRDNMQALITEIAHQLRTPLVNIKTYLDILELPELTENEEKQALQALDFSQQKLTFLVESFIKISRFENKLIQIKKKETNVKETVVEAMFQVHKQAHEKQIDLSLDAKEAIVLSHDKNWLAEAIYNVLDNSVKYSPEESKIDLALSENDLFIQLFIRDYGIGIEKGEEPKIYQRFYRGKRVTTEEGFGVGLYLTREIINQHGGLIKVKREEPGLSVSIILNKR